MKFPALIEQFVKVCFDLSAGIGLTCYFKKCGKFQISLLLPDFGGSSPCTTSFDLALKKRWNNQWTDRNRGDGSSGTKVGLRCFGIEENVHYRTMKEENGKKYRHIFQWNKEYMLNYY